MPLRLPVARCHRNVAEAVKPPTQSESGNFPSLNRCLISEIFFTLIPRLSLSWDRGFFRGLRCPRRVWFRYFHLLESAVVWSEFHILPQAPPSKISRHKS